MNLFEFTTKLAYIDSLTKVKDLEEELRKLVSNVIKDSYLMLNAYKRSNDLLYIIRPFIAYTKCFKRFEEHSKKQLPDYLYSLRKNVATNIIEFLVSNNLTITYQDYLDIFKYLRIDLILPHNYSKSNFPQLIYMTELIQDNVNPYAIDYNKLRANDMYQSLCYDCKELANALEIRQTTYNDKKYTILEDFINLQYNKLYADKSNESLLSLAETTNTNAVNILGASNELLATIKARASNKD